MQYTLHIALTNFLFVILAEAKGKFKLETWKIKAPSRVTPRLCLAFVDQDQIIWRQRFKTQL